MSEVVFYIFSTLLVGASAAVIFSRNPVHSVLFLIFAFFNAAGLFVLMGAEFLAMMLVIVYVGAVAVLFLFIVMMMNITTKEQRSVFSKAHFLAGLKTFSYFVLYMIIFSLISLVMLSIAPIAEVFQAGESFQLDELMQLLQLSQWSVFSERITMEILVTTSIISLLVSRYVAQILTKRKFLDIISGFVDSLYFMLFLGAGLVSIFISFSKTWIPSPFSEDLIASPTPPIDLVSNTHALGQIIYSDYILAFQACGIILLAAMIGAIVLTQRKREGVKKQDVVDQVMRRPKDTMVVQRMPLGKGIE